MRELQPLPPCFELGRGSHRGPSEGMCLLEAAAYVAGEPHSAHPQCVCPVLAQMGRSLNDRMWNPDRTLLLLPLLPSLVGTRTLEELRSGSTRLMASSERRSVMARDWLVREWLPTWLELWPELRGKARALRCLPELGWGASSEHTDAILEAQSAAERVAPKGDRWLRVEAVVSRIWNDVEQAAMIAGPWNSRWTVARTAAIHAAARGSAEAVRGTESPYEATLDFLRPTEERLLRGAFELFKRMLNIGRVEDRS